MNRNPLEDAADALRQIGARVRQTVGDDVADQIGIPKPEPALTLAALQVELDSLVGLGLRDADLICDVVADGLPNARADLDRKSVV